MLFIVLHDDFDNSFGGFAVPEFGSSRNEARSVFHYIAIVFHNIIGCYTDEPVGSFSDKFID